MIKTHNKSNQIKFILISVIMLTLGGVLSVFAGYRHMLNNMEPLVSNIKEGTTMAIQSVRQNATKDGITQWTLNAESASYMNLKNQAVFKKPFVTFFLEDQTQAHLSAQEGLVKTLSNDIQMIGKVIMKNQGYLLETKSLNYTHDKKVFSSDAPIKITGTDMELSADSGSFDLNTKKILFKGNVKGSFGEGIKL